MSRLRVLRRWVCAAVPLACGLAFLLAPASTPHAQPVDMGRIVYVDATAPPGGDGSAERAVRTIQEAVGLVPDGGVVAIHPGTYFGPVVVEQDHVLLWGLATPYYDEDGLLAGFDEEVVVRFDRQFLGRRTPAEGTRLPDLISLRGSYDEVHNLVADLGGGGYRGNASNLMAAFSATGDAEALADGIVFSHLMFRGLFDTGIVTMHANAFIEYATSLGPNFGGVIAYGSGHVDIERVHFSHKAVGVCFLGLLGDINHPTLLTGSLRDSRLREGEALLGFLPQGFGLQLVGRAFAPADQPTTVVFEATGNRFEHNFRAINIVVTEGVAPPGPEDAPTLIELRVDDNAYIRSLASDAEVEFMLPQRYAGMGVYAVHSDVLIEDGDSVFPQSVDVGPPENDNTYELDPLP